MGQLFKRGGTWYADYFDRNGGRCRCSTRTSDIQIARARLRDLELATTDRAAHATETIDAALAYFVDVVHASSPSGTIRCYQQKARHVSRLLGATLLDKLTREAVERYIATRIAEAAHPHSVHKELVVLRGALKSARGRDRFHGDADVVPKFDAQYQPRTVYLTPDQFLSLVDHLVPPPRSNSKPGPLARYEARKANRALYCLLIALASPRRGELEALRWEMIDIGRGVIRIPKGKTVSRLVAIHPVLRPWIEAMHVGDGSVVEPWSNIVRDLELACTRAGVPRVTPNDLRRTFASWLVQAGVSLYVVSRLLGHKSTRMVELVYGQLDEATLAGAIGKLPGGCDAGVTYAVPNRGAAGGGGTAASPPSIVNSVEESAISASSVVPRDGVEPPTRGFSVLMDRAPKRANPLRKLRAV
ncbi:MAG: site-specific integrase [Chloroflexi bacterium]|nr:site-specific integrase [Chloroflexota bacterium]